MRRRLPMIAEVTLPHPLLWILVPAGLLGLCGGKRWVIAGVAPLFVIGYAFYAFFLQPYTLMIAPAIAMCVMLATDTIRRAWPRGAQFTATFLLLSIAGLTIAQLPEFNRVARDQEWSNSFRKLDTQLERLGGPCIVLFRPSNDERATSLPVYNVETAWPDDARVIRANDLGPRNVELFRYYAARSPRRMVYRYDQNDDSIHELGWANELSRNREAASD
jgi:hypothetical protein